MNSPKGEETIFAEALRLPLDERAVYLTEATSGNAELRQRVDGLLGSYEAGDFLEQAAMPKLRQTLDPTVLLAPVTEKPGQTIGRYKLLEQIGEGGCGVVYVAEQTGAIRRRVAVKIIKLGMDTKSVIARFEAERQALALMDHPNIAKVFDAGATETGRPYFVMELVRGMKITDYCDEKKLSPQQRLELFIQVCQAIQHAHQKGIIHRDIKPSNILVTVNDGVPVPKVIDFGVAKATSGQQLTDKTIYTAFEQFIGTPAYMSPEQAVLTSLDIDTRSDIYALGVLLYELLTGKTPFDAKELLAIGLDEMRRAIREQEPQRPSTRLSTLAQNELGTTAQRRGLDPPKLVSELRGDLDWIVMKCIEKDRARRYETANGLAMDVQRHLKNEPVIACPPSRAYRFHKLVRRNKLAFSAASAVATALIIGLSTSTWMFFREREAKHEQERLRRRAETESAKSREVAQFLKDALEGVGPSVALGRDQTMLREILEQTAERIGKDLAGQPEVQVELFNTIGFAYWELGRYDAAEKMYRTSLELMKKLWGNEHSEVSQTLHNLAELLRREARPKEAAASEREALAINKKLFGEHPAVAASLGNLAFVLEVEGKLEEAETLFRQALALNRKLLEKEHPQLGVCLSRFGTVLNAQGKLPEAEAVYREAVAIQTKLLGKKGLGLAPEVELAWTLYYLSEVLEKEGKVSEADATLGEAVATISKVVSADHPDRVMLVGNWIRLNGRHGRLAEAKAILDQQRKLRGDEHLDVAQSLDNLADALGEQGKHVEAESNLRDALAIRIKLLGEDHPDVARSLENVGIALAYQGKYAEAEAMHRQALTMRKKLLGDEDPVVANSLYFLASACTRTGKQGEALLLYKEVLKLNTANLGERHRLTLGAMSNLARAYRNTDDLVHALPLFEETLRLMRLRLKADDPFIPITMDNLASAYRKAGRRDRLEALYREGLAHETGDILNIKIELARLLFENAKTKNPETSTRQDIESEAEQLAHQYLDDARSRYANDPLKLAERLADVAELFYRQGSYEESEPLYREIIALRRSQLTADHKDVIEPTASLARVLTDWAWAERAKIVKAGRTNLAASSPPPSARSPQRSPSERAREAEGLLLEVLALRLSAPTSSWRTGDVKSRLGAALVSLAVTDAALDAEGRRNKLNEAESLLLEGCEEVQRGASDDKYKRDALQRIVRLYEAWNKPDKHSEWQQKLELFEQGGKTSASEAPTPAASQSRDETK